jgi:hypothetical protein
LCRPHEEAPVKRITSPADPLCARNRGTCRHNHFLAPFSPATIFPRSRQRSCAGRTTAGSCARAPLPSLPTGKSMVSLAFSLATQNFVGLQSSYRFVLINCRHGMEEAWVSGQPNHCYHHCSYFPVRRESHWGGSVL